MFKNVLSTIAIIGFCCLPISCDKSSGPADFRSYEVRITVLNSDQEDLLDPSNAFALDLKQVKVYYELNGVKTEINRSNLDNPRMFRLEEPGENYSNYRVLLFMNNEDDSEITTTYFEWGPERTDIFKSQIRSEDGSTSNVALKTWFNDTLVCNREDDIGQCNVTIIME